jgi:hypothetical protein
MNEAFELDGYWWLPDNLETRVPGKLSFTPGDVPRLSLMGALNQNAKVSFSTTEFINPEIILGTTINGNSVTLYKCLQTHGTINLGFNNGSSLTKFIAHFAFMGIHFLSPEEILFSSVNVRLLYLDNWYNKSCIFSQTSENGGSITTFKRPQPIEIVINDSHIRILVDESQSITLNNTNISARVSIEILYARNTAFEEFLNMLRVIQNFFTFTMSEPTFVIELTGRLSENAHTLDDKSIPLVNIKTYYAASGWQPEAPDVHWGYMLLPFTEIESNLPELLHEWIEKSERIKPVFDLFFAGIYRSTYPENEFLNLTQAIETYHRRIHGGCYLSEETYLNGLYQLFVNSIPNNIDKDFRLSLMKGKLRYAFEYSLRKRISLLCILISEKISVTFLSDNIKIREFSERISDTRNYLTHYSPELKELAITYGEGLYTLNRQLMFILKVCFLEELGFTFDHIRTILNKDRNSREFIV